MLLGHPPLWTTASLPRAGRSALPNTARREQRLLQAAAGWSNRAAGTAAPKPTATLAWNWFGWRGVVPRVSVWGLLLSVVQGLHPDVSVCTFSLLLCGFCLRVHPPELVLGDCSAGGGCFHINTLEVAREISHNKHFGGKNSRKWQVSKSPPSFPSTSVCRTLQRQLQNGAHTPSLPVAGNWVIGSRTDFPSLTKKYGPKFAHLRQRKQASCCTRCLWCLAIVACCSLIHAPFMDNWKPIPLEI